MAIPEKSASAMRQAKRAAGKPAAVTGAEARTAAAAKNGRAIDVYRIRARDLAEAGWTRERMRRLIEGWQLNGLGDPVGSGEWRPIVVRAIPGIGSGPDGAYVLELCPPPWREWTPAEAGPELPQVLALAYWYRRERTPGW